MENQCNTSIFPVFPPLLFKTLTIMGHINEIFSSPSWASEDGRVKRIENCWNVFPMKIFLCVSILSFSLFLNLGKSWNEDSYVCKSTNSIPILDLQGVVPKYDIWFLIMFISNWKCYLETIHSNRMPFSFPRFFVSVTLFQHMPFTIIYSYNIHICSRTFSIPIEKHSLLFK